MDEPHAPVKQRSCFNCGFRAETANTVCPKCQRTLQTSTSVRIRGFLLVVCGVILMGMMGYITLWMVTAINNPNPVGGKFNGTPDQMTMIFVLFGALILFGLVSFLTGMWQLILGWRNRLFSWIVVGLGILLFAGSYFFIWKFKG